jgi:asparagine synthase (glutamine-hydrolysing)
MCGIAGIVGAEVAPEVVERMTQTLTHRGPDDFGIWRDSGAELGHTRLSILDLSSAGHQPMTLNEFTITYNGEIYNFKELRRQLDGPFNSDTDTEVVLHLFARDGERCLHQLRGMFAFAIWDSKNRRLFAARDRIGIKPLLYRSYQGGLAFASELKALLELGRPKVDMTALRDYFSYGYIPAPKTIFAGIHKLPAGHMLSWDGTLRISRYWEPECRTTVTDPGQAVEELGDHLRVIIPEHTLADVPVGVLLSGGIDSTTVAAHLEQPRTFTLGVDIKRRDETPKARRVADHFGTDHYDETATSIDLDLALDVTPLVFDEPFGDSSAWSNYLVSALARRHVTVALSGEGGDELFCGYQWYSKWLADTAGPATRLLAALLPPFSSGARSCQRRSSAGLERYAAFLGPFTSKQKSHLLGELLLDEGYDDLWFFRQHWREDLDPLRRMQWADLHTYLPEDLLTKVDRSSMAHSLEIRPPLLDHRLVEFALSVDPRLLRDVEGGRGKLIVRRLMDGRVPQGLFDQAKRGFNLPIRSWARSQPELLSGALSRLAEAGVIRPLRRPSLTNEQTWSLLVLDRWMTSTGAL